MDKSKFSMWRASFAFCHVDSVLSAEEKEWITAKLKALPFNEEERKIITSDMSHPPKMDEIISSITNPADKGFLVNEIRKLAHIDKNLSPEEKEKIAKVQAAVMSKIDITGLEQKVEREKLDDGKKESFFESFFNRN